MSSSSSSSSSESDDESDVVRGEDQHVRSKEKSKRKKSKKKKKKKKKRKKKRSSRERELKREIRATERKIADAEEATRLGLPVVTVEDDFYARAKEFRAWLSLKQVYLDELNAAEAHREFEAFAHKWNTGKLTDAFYKGQIDVLQLQPSTRHKWAFVSKLTEKERFDLNTMRDSAQVGESLRTKRNVDTHKKRQRDQPPAPDYRGGRGRGDDDDDGDQRRHKQPRHRHDEREEKDDTTTLFEKKQREKQEARVRERARMEEDRGFAAVDDATLMGSDGRDDLRRMKEAAASRRARKK